MLSVEGTGTNQQIGDILELDLDRIFFLNKILDETLAEIKRKQPQPPS